MCANPINVTCVEQGQSSASRALTLTQPKRISLWLHVAKIFSNTSWGNTSNYEQLFTEQYTYTKG